MAKSIAFVNIKGGVGKTTGVYNVAGILSKLGNKVLCIDLDRQMNLTRLMLQQEESNYNEKTDFSILDIFAGKKSFEDVVKKNFITDISCKKPEYYNIDIIPAARTLKKNEKIREFYDETFKEKFQDFVLANEYDYVLVDLPANSEILNEICFNDIVNYVIVPFTADIFSLDGYEELMNIINEARKTNDSLEIIGIYLNRYTNGALDKEIKAGLESFGNIFMSQIIPMRSDVHKAIVQAKPLAFYSNSKKCDARYCYEGLVNEIIKRINE